MGADSALDVVLKNDVVNKKISRIYKISIDFRQNS